MLFLVKFVFLYLYFGFLYIFEFLRIENLKYVLVGMIFKFVLKFMVLLFLSCYDKNFLGN